MTAAPLSTREHDALREAVDVGDEAVADPDRHDHAVRAGPDAAAVVGLGARVLGLAGAVAVLRPRRTGSLSNSKKSQPEMSST